MTYIIKEIPFGLIDWNNRIFSFSEKIKQLDDLWLDWAIYTDFIVDWKDIILSHAPKLSIYWDYYTYGFVDWTTNKYIKKEVPDWKISGENKKFILKENISKIISVWFDWAIYNNFSTDWRAIILEDAPQFSLFVDYYWLSNLEYNDTNISFAQIKKEVWRLIWHKNTSKNFSSEYIWNKINIVANDIWSGNIINLLDPRTIIKSSVMSFQKAEYIFRSRMSSVLFKELSPWDFEINTNTNNFLENSFVLIDWDIVSYWRKTTKYLERAIWININHFAWTKVEQLYELPDDFFIWVWLFKLEDNRETEISFEHWKESFSILTDSKTRKKLLKINNFQENIKFKLVYIKSYPNIYDDSDFCPFPGNYWLTVLALLTAWIIAQENSMPMASNLLSMAYSNLQAMYSFFSTDIKKSKQKILPRAYSFASLK